MVISRSIILSIIIIVIVSIIVIVKRSSSTLLPMGRKIYVGYVPQIGGGVSFEIDYLKNNVSTLTAGYGITEVSPLDGGNTLNTSFTCDFKEIVKNKSKKVFFNRSGIDWDLQLVKEDGASNNIKFTPYRIHDIAHIYQTFNRKVENPPVEVHTSNNIIFVAYLGLSEDDQKNLFFIDIDYQTNNIYTLNNTYEPVIGEYTGDLNNSFTVKFKDSFLGDKELEITRLDDNTYNAKILNSRFDFPLEELSIIDISKLYSLLLFKGSIGLQLKKSSRRGRTLKYGFPRGFQRNVSENFFQLYKVQKMVKLDFENIIKKAEYSKKMLLELQQKK